MIVWVSAQNNEKYNCWFGTEVMQGFILQKEQLLLSDLYFLTEL